MSAVNYEDLKQHENHNIVWASYGDANIAIECEDCYEVLTDVNADGSKEYNTLIHVDTGDAYQFPYVNKLTAADVKKEIKKGKTITSMKLKF